jgi:hypothetical protein
MEKTNSIIKQNVMRRVQAMHTMRLIGRMGFSLVVFAASLYAIGREVWVARVLHNMPSLTDAPAALSFFLSAFRETHAIVQLTIVLSLVAAFWFAKEIISVLQLPQHRFA